MAEIQHLVGRVVARRFTVLEHTGPERYRVYDMKTLRHIELQIHRTATGIVYGLAAPPVPSDSADLLEEAWFVRGDELQDATASDAEVTDYVAYQGRLKEIASRLRRARQVLGVCGVPLPRHEAEAERRSSARRPPRDARSSRPG